jgi:hypothetical protein
VEAGHDPDNDSLDGVHELLAGLSGQPGSGDLLGWVGVADLSDLPGEVYSVLGNSGLLRHIGRPRSQIDFPANPDALMDQLWEVDESTAKEMLTVLAATTRPARARRKDLRRGYQADPQVLFDEVVRLVGPAGRWWTSSDLIATWNPVTSQASDALLVAAGNGIIVTLIGFDDQG